MSEHDHEHHKEIEIGKLVERYSELNGKLIHVTESLRVGQIQGAIVGQLVAQGNNPNMVLQIKEGKLYASGNCPLAHQPPYQPYFQQGKALEGLLNSEGFVHLLNQKNELSREVAEVKGKLKELAPHLLPA